MRTGVGSKGEVRQARQKRRQRGADGRKVKARTERKMQGNKQTAAEKGKQ